MSCSTNGIGPDTPENQPKGNDNTRDTQRLSALAFAVRAASPASCFIPSITTRSRLLLHSRKNRLCAAFGTETQPWMADKRPYPNFPTPHSPVKRES